jgi:hypothetical protein
VRPSAVIAIATITAAVVVGVLDYHRVLDPGRAERDGVTLNLLVDRGNEFVPNDWYTAGGADITTGHGVLRIVARADGWALESRILPLLSGDCYRVEVRAASSRGVAVIAAYDAELTRFSSYAPLPAAMGRASFIVSAADERITLAVAATRGAHLTLAGVELRRLSRTCTTPRTGRDIGQVLSRLPRS